MKLYRLILAGFKLLVLLLFLLFGRQYRKLMQLLAL